MIRHCEPRNRIPVSWACSNPSCKCKVLISDELMQLCIQERMNLIADNLSLLETEKECLSDKAETTRDTAEIRRLCDTNNYTEEQLLEKILSMAQTRYRKGVAAIKISQGDDLIWVLHTLYMQKFVFGINGSALTHMFVKLTAR